MSSVDKVVEETSGELSTLSNGNGKLKKINPKKGLCPNYLTCANYSLEAYDCNTSREYLPLLTSFNRFPCYNLKKEKDK